MLKCVPLVNCWYNTDYQKHWGPKRVWQNADETSVQFIVGFRPLLGSRVASA
ncbi:hypothetical protein HAX54_037181, partial [Datura stramonium]|nr:hypothetical protein [Datura stramonium]